MIKRFYRSEGDQEGRDDGAAENSSRSALRPDRKGCERILESRGIISNEKTCS